PVQRVVCADRIFDVDGVGYAPQGNVSIAESVVDPAQYSVLNLAVRAGVLCNDGRLRQIDGQWHIEGDPTEGALLALGGKLGLTQDESNAAGRVRTQSPSSRNTRSWPPYIRTPKPSRGSSSRARQNGFWICARSSWVMRVTNRWTRITGGAWQPILLPVAGVCWPLPASRTHRAARVWILPTWRAAT